MILGMSIPMFTMLHVIISLIGIASGLFVLYGMITVRRYHGLTGLFLATTVLTSVTGFFFPFASFGPSHMIGVISLVLLTAAILALYVFHLERFWRWIYISCAVAALWLNVFVGVVQAFQKLAFLSPLAPTQSEPPFLIAQVVVLAVFVVFGFVAVRKFRPGMRGLAWSSFHIRQ